MMRHVLMALAAPLLLTGCLLSPGKFASELQLMKDGSFAFTYDGEVQMLALSKLAEMANEGEAEFEAECYDDEFEERDCTDAEIAEQRADWDANAESRAEEEAREAKAMQAFLGGIDPADPEAANELAERLERQRGWNSVDYRGDGLFVVEFAISGSLDHDFVFPTIERMPTANAFVSVNLRDSDQVRVDAPGYGAQQEANPMFGGASLAAMAAMAEGDENNELPNIVSPEGTFTIVTDGRILANNTDEGPVAHASGQSLAWEITPRTNQPPTALIALD